MLDRMIRDTHPWLITILLFLLLASAAQAGAWIRRHDRQSEQEDEQPEGQLLSAMMALLGLLIAFTFSLALNRYDARRIMVVEEGNAISTAWFRATLIDGSEGLAYRDAIRRYTDIRVRLPDSDKRAEIERQSERAQVEVWTALKAALPHTEPPIGATMVNATTEMFDAAARRKAERRARIPSSVLAVVSLYAVLSAGVVGYFLGRRRARRHVVLSLILFLLLALAMSLILDLDRPWSGGIRISPQPIIDARAAMN